MKKATHLFGSLFILLIILFVSACSNEEEQLMEANEQQSAETTENKEEQLEQNETSFETDSEESIEVSESVKKDPIEEPVELDNAPDDQGDLNVWFDGNVTVENKTVIVNGTTNLLPESELTLRIDSEEGSIIGGSERVKVSTSGEFELESKFPDEFAGIAYIELKFEPANQDEEIKNHYQDQLTGDYIRLYSELDNIYQKASFQQTVMIDGQQMDFPISKPIWEVPEDYGDVKVWVEPTIEKQGEYIVVNISSNILEGAFIRARAEIPNYITTGFQGYSTTNPDGSAVIYINDPEKDERIENLSTYNIIVTMDPSHNNNGPHILETYGENGENLEGELVKEENKAKTIEKSVTITVE